MNESIKYKGFSIGYDCSLRGFLLYKIGGDKKDGLVVDSIEFAKSLIDSILKHKKAN